MAGSAVPAREAARAAPAAALKSGDRDGMLTRLRPAWPGLACLAGAALLVGLPPIAGLPLAGYAAIASLLVGTLLLLPRFASWLLARVPRPRSAVAALALDQLRGAPGQVAMSLAAIVASVALMVSMAIMVASFRHSLEAWLDAVLPAELYVRAGFSGDSAYFDPAAQQAIATTPGVRQAEFLRVQRLVLDAERPGVTLLARDANPEDGQLRLPLVDHAITVPKDAPSPLYASEAMADLHGYVPGARVVLPVGGREVAFTVAGMWRDYARQTGAVAIDRALYIRLTGDRNADDAALWLAPGADPAAVRREIEKRSGGADRVTLAAPGEIRSRSLAVFDRTFAVTYALEAAAVGLGLVALSATFGALTLGRRREFGMLRHLGMTRRQVGAMLACEGALVSGVGLVAGLVPGFVISLILIHVVNRQSFHWGMTLHMPWLILGVLSLALLALATLTAVASARGAMGGSVVRAVREDW
jgi:putative ABC transport system permease protein